MAQNEDPESAEVIMKQCLLAKCKRAIIVKGPNGVTEYCCVECSLKFSEKSQMEQHLSVHNREYRFLCGICGTALKRKEHLDRHTMEHQEVRPHVCPDCGKAFKRKEHLNIHRTIHSGQKNYTCPLCERSFYRKDHLQKHLQTHNKMLMEQNIFPSEHELMDVEPELDIKQETLDDGGAADAGGVFDPEVMMEIREALSRAKHTAVEQQVDPARPHACLECGKTYKRKDHLKLHSVSHMAKDKACHECGKAFRTEGQLQSHMSVHVKPYVPQEEGDESFVASMEDDLESEPESLLIPRSALPAPESERPHECPICHRRFKRKQHLKVHANVHVKQLPPTIWCSICSEGFFDNSHFESHQCLGEEGSPAAPRSANQENDYPTRELVQVLNEPIVDERAPAPAPPPPTPRRVFVCRYCAKPFKRKDHYRIHLHVHTGVKSFFCPDCGKGFYRKDHLQKHAQVHVKHKPKMAEMMRKVKKELPELFPIRMLPRPAAKPEITITAPANVKLRVPLQMKVPYQVVTSTDSGEQRAVTVHPCDLLA